MRRIFLSSLIILLSFGVFIQDASARGFGGGRGFSMGRARPAFSQSFRNQRTATAPARSNKWRGALTGFMLGSLLSSLFMGHGLGGGLMSWLFLGGIIWFVLNALKRRKYHRDFEDR